MGKEATQFKPGQSGNVSGRPRDVLCKTDLDKIIGKLSRGTVGALKEIVATESSEPLDAMVAAIMLKTIEQGDAHRFNVLMDRAVGKIKEVIETHSISEGEDKLTLEDLKKLAA